ncbi:Phage protein [Yersinia phage fHe-Yen9-03]|uniref:Phage protein n=1 Tax=Yersinia phage fHe-Yen9-03 TaxID=2052743 RepID=A0A2C9CYK9_9CAUD|nr:Phage protein [Yersinia phage fHe-Yen9-03]
MKKILTVLLISFILSGCDGKSENRTEKYDLPTELKDCQIYKLTSNSTSKTLYVVRCPNSSTQTTFNSGKNNSTSISYNE